VRIGMSQNPQKYSGWANLNISISFNFKEYF
jgi:hypothetical protein